MKLISLLIAFSVSTGVLADEKHQQVTLKGQWLVEENGGVMQHPQTSGLKLWRGKLLTVSDRSAHKYQQKQLHIIEPKTALVNENSLMMKLSDNVKNSCFSQYLAGAPDLEALVVDPINDNVFYVVTEDARQGKALTPLCEKRFRKTGSTVYPSLLVRLELGESNTLLMTHVRPIQFKTAYKVGDFANDGIEGLAINQSHTLYLGLEKDIAGSARIFSTQMNKGFWQSDEFIQVVDTNVVLPVFDNGNHPINGMDHFAVDNHPGYIIAAARNDDQLWVIDLANKKPTKVISLNFLAPIDKALKECAGNSWETIGNTSLEGVAVDKNKVWLINDPWTKHYLDNIKCPSNRDKYKQLAPLLFSLPISNNWFE